MTSHHGSSHSWHGTLRGSGVHRPAACVGSPWKGPGEEAKPPCIDLSTCGRKVTCECECVCECVCECMSV